MNEGYYTAKHQKSNKIEHQESKAESLFGERGEKKREQNKGKKNIKQNRNYWHKKY